MAGKRVNGTLQQRCNKGGWTEATKKLFLARLAEDCNVTAACGVVGKFRASAYSRRYKDPAFAQQWDAMLEQGYARLEMELVARALGNGVAETADGTATEPACEPRPFDPDLALRVLALRNKAGGGKPPGRSWTRGDPPAVLASLNRKLLAMEKRLEQRT